MIVTFMAPGVSGPRVTEIEIWGLEAGSEPPRPRVTFRFAGRQRRVAQRCRRRR
jgi:hypothetical protein